MNPRQVRQLISAMPTSDGAGVKLKRSLGQRGGARLDPFLMLDEFASDDARDYLAGFPAHPHRGFETVTYMLAGHMLHEDHLGNRGELKSGGVQWMTAARGIIHSEMPQQESGRMHGFQLWINLPAAEKMKEPSYQDLQAEDIPRVTFEGGELRAIAGEFELQGRQIQGAVHGISRAPLYLDLRMRAGAKLTLPVASGHNSFVYVYAGAAAVGTPSRNVTAGEAALLSDGDSVEIVAGEQGAQLLLLAARPIGEPVVQYGPFVMNTEAEIVQAIHDYQNGTLAPRPAARH